VRHDPERLPSADSCTAIAWENVFPDKAIHRVLDDCEDHERWMRVAEESMKQSPFTSSMYALQVVASMLTSTQDPTAGE
jgi:hypothetical protein